MAFHLFLFLLAVCLILSLALLWRLDWLHLRSASSRGGAKRSRLHRLLKPRTPADGPACRLASPPSSAGRPAPLPERRWPEVKSRRGAPKRRDTAGLACPNPQCPSFGITDAHIHALVVDGKHGRAEPIGDLSRPCVPQHVQCPTPPPLPFKNPFPAGRRRADLALAEGLDPSEAPRVAGLSTSHHHEPCSLVQASMRRPCMSAPSAICGSHICSWTNGAHACATRHRCVFLWLAIDPLSKILPVLHVGPRTHLSAQTVIHSLRQILAAFLHPPFHQRWFELVLLCVFRPILASGLKWFVEAGKCPSGTWRQA
jgi:hypothetical protein